MRDSVINSKAILSHFRSYGLGESSFDEAVSNISEIIRENIAVYSVMENAQNAAQIANLLTAELYPKDPLSMFVLKGVGSGRLPEFSNEPPSENALLQGCAVLAVNLAQSYHFESPNAEAARLLEAIERSGLLPELKSVRE